MKPFTKKNTGKRQLDVDLLNRQYEMIKKRNPDKSEIELKNMTLNAVDFNCLSHIFHF